MKNDRGLALGLLALICVPTLLLLDCAQAVSHGWRLESRLDLAVLCAAVFALFGVAIMVTIRTTRAFVRRGGVRLTLAVTTGVCAWLACEGLVLLFTPAPSGIHTKKPNRHFVFNPSAGVMPGVHGEAHYTTNAHGIRGPEFPENSSTYRILCIGGSTTECAYLDDTETWPRLLMEQLNTAADAQRLWVGDVGVSGYATPRHLEFVRSSELMGEIDALVALIGVNDLHWAVQGGFEPDPPSGPAWSHSPILSLARAALHKQPVYSVEDAAGAVYISRRQRFQAMPAVDELPNLDAALRAYAERVEQMARLCEARGVLLVCVTHPVLWDRALSDEARSRLWMGWTADERRPPPEQLRKGMERFNEVLVDTCDRLNVPCIRLDELHGREDFFYDDCHFNEAGAQAVAQRVAAWFLSSNVAAGS